MEKWEEPGTYQLPSLPCGNMGPTLPDFLLEDAGNLDIYVNLLDLIFFFFGCTPHSMWDLNFPTRDQTHTLHRKSCLNPWTAGEIPEFA